jgi:hypothetical protein
VPMLGLAVWGAWLLANAHSVADVLLTLVLFGLAGLLAFVVWMILSGSFSIQVDAHTVSLVNVIGLWSLQLRWEELECIGVIQRGAFCVLAVRPVTPWMRKPRRALLSWDPSSRLLQIAGLDKWSRPADDIIAGIQRYAGSRWTDSFG